MIRRFLILWILLFVGAGLKPVPTEAKSQNTIPVEVVVDFGPANKPNQRQNIEVSKGSTPKDAVSMVFPIMTGFSCCNTREVISIDGVSVNPAENRWWICLLNGSKNVNPQKTQLKTGDVVQWVYITDSQ